MNTKNPATGKGVVRTRIAPTPSGFLHLGNVLSFTLTAALAEKTQASTLLRIDDLDSQRINRLYVVDIFDTLDFLEIPWTEGPTNYQDYQAAYSQLHRLELYNEALRQLQESGYLFACTCSRTDISSRNKKHEVPGANFPENAGYPGTCLNKNLPMNTPGCSWRLRTLAGAANSTDLNIPSSMSGFVVRRKDGVPSYQLASLIDDLHFGINLIVRGEDLRDSTLAQLHLASLLSSETDFGGPMSGAASFTGALFYHHPLLRSLRGQKLSKSAGDISVRHLRKEGLKPRQVYTRIAAMLGSKEDVKDWRTLAAIVLPPDLPPDLLKGLSGGNDPWLPDCY